MRERRFGRSTVWTVFVLALSIIAAVAPAIAAPAFVRLVKDDSGYRLSRYGKPYFIKGAGGDGSLKILADAGGNSIRTWDADKAGIVLDEAQRLGLTVTVGIWLGHERHGFRLQRTPTRWPGSTSRPWPRSFASEITPHS